MRPENVHLPRGRRGAAISRRRRGRGPAVAATGVLLAALLSGCLRYVSHRSHVAEGAKDEEGKTILGPAAFKAVEEREREALIKLLSAREKAVRSGVGARYRVGPGDVIDLKVFDVPELQTSVRVRPDGFLSLPLVGEVKAQGLTESELQSHLTSRLKKFVNEPQVSLFISVYESQKVSVIGEVAKPGPYPLRRDRYSLIELLSEAGGRTEKASTRILLLPGERAGTGDATSVGEKAGMTGDLGPAVVKAAARGAAVPSPGTPEAAGSPSGAPAEDLIKEAVTRDAGVVLDFDDIAGTDGRRPLFVPLLPGDTVVVAEAGKVDVDGEVNRPGSYQLASKTTVLGAVAAAGGLNYSADVNNVEVIRDVGGGRKAALDIDLQRVALERGEDVRLRDGDVVRVPSAGGRFAARQVVEVINRVFNIGFQARP